MPTLERVRHPLALRTLEVTRVQDLTPRLRRITFTAPDLDTLVSAGADDHVKLLFPGPGEEPPQVRLGDNGMVFEEGEERPAMRDFTPRRLDPQQLELDVDFVVHGDGPASTWAAAATPGARLSQAGPRGSLVVGGDVAWYLLAGDETALGSIGRRLDELPDGVPVWVLVEVDGPEGEVELPWRPGVEITWLHRGDTPAGHAGLLERAVRALALPEAPGFAWVACEADEARRLRTHLREERGLPKAWTKATGYWRLGTANHHDAPDS